MYISSTSTDTMRALWYGVGFALLTLWAGTPLIYKVPAIQSLDVLFDVIQHNLRNKQSNYRWSWNAITLIYNDMKKSPSRTKQIDLMRFEPGTTFSVSRNYFEENASTTAATKVIPFRYGAGIQGSL